MSFLPDFATYEGRELVVYDSSTFEKKSTKFQSKDQENCYFITNTKFIQGGNVIDLRSGEVIQELNILKIRDVYYLPNPKIKNNYREIVFEQRKWIIIKDVKRTLYIFKNNGGTLELWSTLADISYFICIDSDIMEDVWLPNIQGVILFIPKGSSELSIYDINSKEVKEKLILPMFYEGDKDEIIKRIDEIYLERHISGTVSINIYVATNKKIYMTIDNYDKIRLYELMDVRNKKFELIHQFKSSGPIEFLFIRPFIVTQGFDKETIRVINYEAFVEYHIGIIEYNIGLVNDNKVEFFDKEIRKIITNKYEEGGETYEMGIFGEDLMGFWRREEISKGVRIVNIRQKKYIGKWNLKLRTVGDIATGSFRHSYILPNGNVLIEFSSRKGYFIQIYDKNGKFLHEIEKGREIFPIPFLSERDKEIIRDMMNKNLKGRIANVLINIVTKFLM